MVPVSDEYREDEKIITGYDPKIVKRLFQFIKPHRLSLAGALLALIIASAAELGMPVIVQRAVDQNLITKYQRISASAAESSINELFDQIDFRKQPKIKDFYYVLESNLTFLSGVDRKKLLEEGFLDKQLFYVFPLNESTTSVIQDNSTMFIAGTEYAAIEYDKLKELSDEEIRTVRSKNIEEIKKKVQFFFVLLGAVFIFLFLQVVLMAFTGQGVMKDMRTKLYDHIIHQSLNYLNNQPVGRLVTRMTNDVETINELFTQVLANLIKNVVMMIGVLVTLFLIDPKLAGVVVLTLPPVFIVTTIFRKKARNAFRNVRRWVSRVNSFLSEHLSGMQVVQIFVQEKRANREFDRQNSSLMKANLTEMYVFAIFRPVIDLLSSVSIAAIIYFGAFFLIQGIISLGVLVAFIDLIRRFYQQLMQISERFVIVQSAMAGSERIFSLLDEEERLPDTGKGALPSPVKGDVIFNNVWFSYKKDRPVIKDLSFSVAPGETVAIVGYTGAGKTTIANLVSRLWDIDSGSITVDGKEIREIPLRNLRNTIQTIQQDVFLFRDTVKENIRLGQDISDEKVVEAGKAVQIDHFVQKMENGYDTVLTEGASNISTGQRQLISFARVIAHDPRIIILDEATSSIDTETEKLIQEALQVTLKGRTSLVIAHRLSTIKNADRILVLSNGKLVEEGNHDSLIADKGLYYNLYKLQYAGIEESVG